MPTTHRLPEDTFALSGWPPLRAALIKCRRGTTVFAQQPLFQSVTHVGRSAAVRAAFERDSRHHSWARESRATVTCDGEPARGDENLAIDLAEFCPDIGCPIGDEAPKTKKKKKRHPSQSMAASISGAALHPRCQQPLPKLHTHEKQQQQQRFDVSAG